MARASVKSGAIPRELVKIRDIKGKVVNCADHAFEEGILCIRI